MKMGLFYKQLKQEFNWKKFSLCFILSIVMILTQLTFINVEIAQAATVKSENWVQAWSTSLISAMDTGISNEGFKNITIRQIVHPHINGSKVRINLSNLYGNKAITFNSVHVALQDISAGIIPITDKKVTFNSGKSAITLLPGTTIWSDPVDLKIVDHNLVISIYIADASGPATWHPMALQTNYISKPGNHTTNIKADKYIKTVTSWFWLSGVEVLADNTVKGTLVIFGDSITDGNNSTIDANRRWPDYLTRRIQRESPQYKLAVLNKGISGNRLMTDTPYFGVKGLDRLERDVLQQKDLKGVIFLLGINDIGNGNYDANNIINGIKEVIRRVHAKGVPIYGGTLTPFAVYRAGYYTPRGEMARETVNNWIKINSAFDGIIDFDQVLRDPKRPLMLLPKYDSGDHIHPNDTGYKAMADAIDLTILTDCAQQRLSINK
jgi:lysophospholipase L1-like esterase